MGTKWQQIKRIFTVNLSTHFFAVMTVPMQNTLIMVEIKTRKYVIFVAMGTSPIIAFGI
jgi:hypothetical protein